MLHLHGMKQLDPADLRRYAQRDWAAPERLAREVRARQPTQRKVAIGIALYEAARATQPGWPDDATRWRDLKNHVRLRSLLMRAAHVGAR